MGGGTDGWAREIRSAHGGYHDETRRHRDPDVLVDDVVTWRMLSPHLIRAALFLVAPTVLALVWLLLGYLAATSSPSITGTLLQDGLAVVVVILYLAGLAAFFAPAKEPIAEYSRLLEGRAGAALGAREWVARAARSRRTPAEVSPRTVAGVPVLVFRQRSERAMLLVQPYGADLYVGWTMWRSRSTAALLAHFLRDTFGRFTPVPVFSAELRAASTRAMRESVHSLAREGVAAAAWADETGADLERSEWSERSGSVLDDERPLPDRAGAGRGERPGPDEHAHPGRDDPRREPEALPRPAPAVDPAAGWLPDDRAPDDRVPAAPRDQGWGPPPRP